MQTDRKAVEFGLTNVFHRFITPQTVPYPSVKIPQFIVRKGVIQRKHGQAMDHLGKGVVTAGTNTLGGGIRCHELGMCGFQGLQFPHQTIVFRIRNGGLVQHVVTIIVVVNNLAKFLDTTFRG